MQRQDLADVRAQLHAASRAVFDWSVANQASFELLMGSAYPAAASSGEDIPRSISRELGGVFPQMFTRLWQQGALDAPADHDLPETLRNQLEAYRQEACPQLQLGVAYLMLTCWRQIYGLICMAVYNHLDFAVKDHGDFFEEMMVQLLAFLGLRVSPGLR